MLSDVCLSDVCRVHHEYSWRPQLLEARGAGRCRRKACMGWSSVWRTWAGACCAPLCTACLLKELFTYWKILKPTAYIQPYTVSSNALQESYKFDVYERWRRGRPLVLTRMMSVSVSCARRVDSATVIACDVAAAAAAAAAAAVAPETTSRRLLAQPRRRRLRSAQLSSVSGPGRAVPSRAAGLPDRCGPRDTLSSPVRSGQIEICHTSSSSLLSVIDAAAATVRSLFRSFVRYLHRDFQQSIRSVTPASWTHRSRPPGLKFESDTRISETHIAVDSQSEHDSTVEREVHGINVAINYFLHASMVQVS